MGSEAFIREYHGRSSNINGKSQISIASLYARPRSRYLDLQTVLVSIIANAVAVHRASVQLCEGRGMSREKKKQDSLSGFGWSSTKCEGLRSYSLGFIFRSQTNTNEVAYSFHSVGTHPISSIGRTIQVRCSSSSVAWIRVIK